MSPYLEPSTAFTEQVLQDLESVTRDGLAPLRDGRASEQVLKAYQARLENHSICFVIPAGAVVDNAVIRLRGGILVLGAMRGKVTCATGSAIIGSGGEFQGTLEADDVLIEGHVTSPLDSNAKPVRSSLSDIRARGRKDEITGEFRGGFIMLSGLATVCARMRARGYQIPRNTNIDGSIMETLSER